MRLIFSEFFLLFIPSIFDILQQNGCSKNPKASPFYIFWHYATYRKFKKNSTKKFGIFFSIFSFLRAFVVSSCRKSGFRFRVFLSLRYDADLGRSRLVYFSRGSLQIFKTFQMKFRSNGNYVIITIVISYKLRNYSHSSGF